MTIFTVEDPHDVLPDVVVFTPPDPGRDPLIDTRWLYVNFSDSPAAHTALEIGPPGYSFYITRPLAVGFDCGPVSVQWYSRANMERQRQRQEAGGWRTRNLRGEDFTPERWSFCWMGARPRWYNALRRCWDRVRNAFASPRPRCEAWDGGLRCTKSDGHNGSHSAPVPGNTPLSFTWETDDAR